MGLEQRFAMATVQGAAHGCGQQPSFPDLSSNSSSGVDMSNPYNTDEAGAQVPSTVRRLAGGGRRFLCRVCCKHFSPVL